MESGASAELTAAFTGPFAGLGNDPARDRGIVVAAWPSVPVEIIRAAGLRPVFARGGPAATPAADAVLEPGVFPNRIRQLFEAALTGRLAHVAAIVLPRTSDHDYKAFLYMKELQRRGRLDLQPPVLLFDLLQSAGVEVAAYDTARTRELAAWMQEIGSARATADLGGEIARTNAARGAARQLQAVREATPHLHGAEALPLLGAFWQLPPVRYTLLVNAATGTLAARAPIAGPRVLLAGAPVDSPTLHASIESLHATVVDEVTPYGSDAAAQDVSTTIDPPAALADWYRRFLISARAPGTLLLRRIENSLGGIDAAVILLPPEDARFGWDYPQLRDMLARRAIAHVVLQVDPESPLGAADRQRIQAMLAGTTSRQAVRHG
jgi:2-hydroxyglutaryl-CoA dehydratase, D-component